MEWKLLRLLLNRLTQFRHRSDLLGQSGFIKSYGTCSGRKQNLRDFSRTLDVAVVARVHFADLPSASTSLLGKWLEERPRRVCFRNAANENSRNTGLAVLAKTKRFLKAAQTEITEPLAHKISRLSWLQTPEV